MKKSRLYIVIAAVIVLAFVGVYAGYNYRVCTINKTKNQIETNLEKAPQSNQNESIFFGCNGFF